MLSKPKPASFEWYERGTDNAVLLGVSFDEGQFIYLWLRIADALEPRSYVIPWNLKLAEKLYSCCHQFSARKMVAGTGFRLDIPGDHAPRPWGLPSSAPMCAAMTVRKSSP